MATEFLTFGAQEILKKLALLAGQEFGLVRGSKRELAALRESLAMTQAMLRDAEQSHVRSEAVEMWVKKLQDIAHDADHVLDEHEYEVLRRRVELQNQRKKKVLDFFSYSNPIAFRLKMAHKIKKINTSLESLNKMVAGMGLVDRAVVEAPSHEIGADRETTSSFDRDEKCIVGRAEVVSEIVKTLINSSNNQENYLSIMAIVGMAGLGKTTLAKLIYHEYEIGRHFHEKIWICVSTRFKVNTILSGILEKLKPEKAGIRGKATICENLQEHLKGKRYLLVLDDVWNDDPQKWDNLISCLSNVQDTKGSNILVTTRSVSVASIVQTLPRHDLRKLSNEECWLILKDKAFPDGSAPLTNDEGRIARGIAKKCVGVPLVAKVLGNMMRSKKRDGWCSIQECNIWDLPEGGERILSVLKLSFDQLKSSSLKQCFAYCSMFSKDFKIQKDDLIQLWMAQGLLHPFTSEGNLEMEDIGEKYFRILSKNSFFQDVTKDDHDIITECKMHHLFHDLAKHISESMSKDFNQTRHMAEIPTSVLLAKKGGHELHSVFVKHEVLGNALLSFKGLRVLKLYEADIDELPISIGKMKHLRYLDVSRTKIKSLPKSIGKLYNLQTLRMDCLNFEEFPKEVQNLISLRHIYFKWDCEKFPVRMGRLTNLRSLSFFIVGKEMGRGIEELAGLRHLKGKLSLYNLEHVTDGEEAKKAKLVEKTSIWKLSFEWQGERLSINNDEDVLKGLQPHPKLEFLEIRNFMGEKFPSWMMISLFPAMKTLTIDNAKNLIEWMEAATSLTEVVVFPCLEELFLRKCDQLRSVPSHFPSLQKLEIDSMDSSKPIENISKKLTTLTSLTIENVRGLASLPEVMLKNNQNLANLEIRDCGNLSCIAPHVFGCCASLESLSVSKCHNIRSLPDGLHTLSLKELIVDNCPRLEFIPVTHALTSLLKLSVKYCRSLKSVPTLNGFASLRQLEIEGFHGTSPLIGLESCTSLHSLRIYGCERLTHLPDGLKILVSLEELTISRCPSLQTIPSLDNLAHLRELKISFCAGLKSLPRGLASPHCLTSLKELEIGRFSMVLHSFPTFQVSQLERLSLWGWPKLESLPEQAQHFTSLTCLEILSFDGMEALPEWLRNLASLEYLRIIWCTNLMYLPTVEAVQCLTKLKEIYISGCPLLQERCNKESGAEWPKISHIPKITVQD